MERMAQKGKTMNNIERIDDLVAPIEAKSPLAGVEKFDAQGYCVVLRMADPHSEHARYDIRIWHVLGGNEKAATEAAERINAFARGDVGPLIAELRAMAGQVDECQHEYLARGAKIADLERQRVAIAASWRTENLALRERLAKLEAALPYAIDRLEELNNLLDDGLADDAQDVADTREWITNARELLNDTKGGG